MVKKISREHALGSIGMYLVAVNPEKAKGVIVWLEDKKDEEVLAYLSFLRSIVANVAMNMNLLGVDSGNAMANMASIAIEGALRDFRFTDAFLENTK